VINNSNINKLPAQNNYWTGGATLEYSGTHTVSAEPHLTSDPNFSSASLFQP
jgi:hypothetical protein